MANDLFEAVVSGNSLDTERLTKQGLEAGVNPADLVCKVIVPALEEAGRRFDCNEYYVPELLISARAAKTALRLLEPALKKVNHKTKGCVVIGCVQGELHDIGIRVIGQMLDSIGFKVVELGADVPGAKFVTLASENNADLVMLSVSNLSGHSYLKQVVMRFKEAESCDKIKVMVGGSTITRQYADEIGADGYAENVVGAVKVAQLLVPTA